MGRKPITQQPIYMGILLKIHQKGQMRPQELCSAYEMSPGLMASKLRNLQQLGLIEQVEKSYGYGGATALYEISIPGLYQMLIKTAIEAILPHLKKIKTFALQLKEADKLAIYELLNNILSHPTATNHNIDSFIHNVLMGLGSFRFDKMKLAEFLIGTHKNYKDSSLFKLIRICGAYRGLYIKENLEEITVRETLRLFPT